jgi:small nuclear ribonucleoprotein D3
MSVSGTVGIGIPLCLLYESEGLTVTVETRLGELYRGILIQAEDNMNLFLRNVSFTDREGKASKLEQVYLRGDRVRYIILPDVMAQSPMFKRVLKYKETKGRYVPKGSGTERAGRIVEGPQGAGAGAGAGFPGARFPGPGAPGGGAGGFRR